MLVKYIQKIERTIHMKEMKIDGITSFSLHILAMALMLCDHLWATLFPAQEWMTCIGRMAFPVFAFMIVEGYFYTSNVRRYMGRILCLQSSLKYPLTLFMEAHSFFHSIKMFSGLF